MAELDALLERVGDVDVRPVDVGHLVARARHQRRARRAAVIATGAALSVALLAGALAVVSRDTSSTEVDVGGDVGPSSLPTRWERRPSSDEVGGMKRIVTVRGRTLGLGSIVSADGMSPAIWAATPGGWTLVYADRPVASANHGQVSDVTYFDGRFVAVGQRRAISSSDVVAGVWTSTDGRAWMAVDHPSLSPPGPPIPPDVSAARASISRVVAGRRGLLAFGETFEGLYVTPQAVMWSSADGTNWSWARLAQLGGPPSVVRAAARVGDEVLIAGWNGQAAAWASRDGRSWRAVPVDGGTASSIEALAVSGGRVVAVGTRSPSNDRSEVVAWRMTGSGRLERVVLADARHVARAEIVSSPAGFVIVGWGARQPDVPLFLAAWTSPDGETWRAAGDDGPVFERDAVFDAVGIADGHFVVVGATITGSGSMEDPARPSAALWYGFP